MAVGQTPAPAYKRGQNDLPQGSVAAVNAAASSVPQPSQFVPQTPQEDFIFSPTSRPDEPVTHGAPFGDGAMFVPMPADSDAVKRQRLAAALVAAPTATPEVRAFAKRVLRGD